MLYIHAGTGKTGTSFLQAYLATYAEDLSLVYPLIGRECMGSQLQDGHHRLALNYQGVDSKQEWINLIDHIGANDPRGTRAWVISTENLTYSDKDFIGWISERLDKACIEHKYIICVRDSSSYTASTFLEYIKVGRVPVFHTVREFLDIHFRSMLVEDLIAKFISASSGRVFLVDYDLSTKKNTLLQDFLLTLGVDSSLFNKVSSARFNRRINPSLYPQLVSYLTFLSAEILDGKPSHRSPEDILLRYASRIESEVAESSSYITDKGRLNELIMSTVQGAIKPSVRDYILASNASSITSEFNSAWKGGLIVFRRSQNHATDIRLSDQYPRIIKSTQATRLLLQEYGYPC